MNSKITQIIDRTHDTKSFRLKPDELFSYKPGQFVMISAAIDGKMVKRAYSFSSSPLEKEFIEVTAKFTPGGIMSQHLFSLKTGDSLNIAGPFGKFGFLSEDDFKKEIIFIAGGAGI